MCAPRICDDGAIFHSLLPALVELSNRPLVVEEVFTWGALDLDFVIVGVAKCGTSTLAANLHQHPLVEMAGCSDAEVCEAMLWSIQHQHDSLLTSSAVASVDSLFSSRSRRSTDIASPSQSLPSVLLRGVKDSRVLEDDRAIAQLAQIQGIRAVVVLRDPIDALESHYNAAECWRIQSIGEMAQRGVSDCLGGSGWGRWSDRIKRLQAAIGREFVFLVHLDVLAAPGPQQLSAYNGLLRFLGVPRIDEFKPGHTFARSNERKMPRARDLCSAEHQETLEQLKILHAEEYPRLSQLLHEVGATVPYSLAARRTRCDWVDAPTLRLDSMSAAQFH